MGSLSLLHGIFTTQGSNPGLPHCRPILHQLSHKEGPRWSSDGQNLGPGFRLWTVAQVPIIWPEAQGTTGTLRGLASAGKCGGQFWDSSEGSKPRHTIIVNSFTARRKRGLILQGHLRSA